MSEALDYKQLKLARNRVRDAAYRAKNREKMRARNKAWYQANRDKAYESSKRWKARNPHEHRNRKYGITASQWDALFESQGRACAACSGTEHRSHAWHTDHCHKTGLIRGILCGPCNIALGILGDDFESVQRGLTNLLAYLRPATGSD